MSLPEAFNIGGEGDDGAELTAYAVAKREVATIDARLETMLTAAAALRWPVD